MDWFTLGALVAFGAIGVLIAYVASRAGRSRRAAPRDVDDPEDLEWRHDDIKRGTSWESSGL